MTKKQDQILETTLHLFSEEGYHATSTSRVAKIAGVSEGLIFRHFQNKEGLLKTVLNEGKQRVNGLLLPIINEEEPKEVIKKTLQLLFVIEDDDWKYWKLLLKLKWELGYQSITIFEPLKPKLIKAFTKLRYRNPLYETKFLLQHLNGLIASLITETIDDKQRTKEFLLQKYYF